MTRVSATQERSTLPTPYVDLDRRAWSRLRESHPMSLEQSDLARLGIDTGLRRAGIVPGDLVRIGATELEWEPEPWDER